MTEAAFHVTGKGEARGSGVFESCVLICRRNNPIFDSKKNQTPLESLFYKGFTAVLLCFQV